MAKLKKIELGSEFYQNLGKGFYDNPRYYRKTKYGYELISLAKLLKECYPKKYKMWLEKERVRAKLYYQKNNKLIECDCGCTIKERGLEAHQKTKKHDKLIKKIRRKEFYEDYEN